MKKTIYLMASSFFFLTSLSYGADLLSLSNPAINQPAAVPEDNIASTNGLDLTEVTTAYQKNVKLFQVSDEDNTRFINQIKESHPENKFIKDQFFVVADRNPKNQVATLAYWDNTAKTVQLYGYTQVSTGSVRKEHFYSPVGWFQSLPANGSYRAQGTKNENGIRGYGRKGMRVWDFGWVPASSGFKKGLNIDIRFQMHATDPDYLEQRLGKPDSQGCIRIHNTFNSFLDQYGIIDSEYEKINSWVLRKDRIQIKNAGSYLLIVDTEIKPEVK